MRKLFILLAFVPIMTVLLSAGSYAYPITFNWNSDEEFSLYVTGCTDSTCSSLVSTSYTITQGDSTAHSFQITGSGTQYSAAFAYADDFLPHGYVIQTEDSN